MRTLRERKLPAMKKSIVSGHGGVNGETGFLNNRDISPLNDTNKKVTYSCSQIIQRIKLLG